MSRAVDLRKPFPPHVTAAILNRAEALDHEERALLREMLADGKKASSLASAARARGSRTTSRRLRSRVRRIARRVLSPRYLLVLRHRDSWTPLRRQIATSLYIHGRSLRGIARDLGWSVAAVRAQRAAIDALIERRPPPDQPPHQKVAAP